MAAPWEKYKKQQSGSKKPWEKFARPKEETSTQAPEQEKALPWYTPITSAPGDAYDMAKGFATGVAGQVEKLAKDPRRLNPLVSAYQDVRDIAAPVVADPKGAYDAAKQSLGQNFGTPTRAWNTVAQNPVDALLMAAPGFGIASKGATAGNMPRLASGLSKAEKFLDPSSLTKGTIERGANLKADLFSPVPEGQTRGSAALLRRLMPKNLDAMDALGEQAMLLDASPSMTGLARGVSANVGKGTDDMVGALIEREKGKAKRLQVGAENIFGKGRDPNAMLAELHKKAQAESSAFYKKAKEETPEFRNSELPGVLAHQFTDPAKGMTQSARTSNLGWMNQVDDAMLADTPQDAASRLHGLRQELDAVINPGPMASATERNTAIAAKNARDIVDDILKNRIPGFAEGDAAFSKRMKQKDAFQYGYDSLEGGKSAVWPETFGKEIAKMPDDYVAQGQASRIGNAMGTQANDLAALRKMIGGDGDFNRAKLEMTFGPRKVDEGVGLVDAEGQMSQNFADIVRNSKTAQSQQAAKLIENNQPFKVDGGLTTLGLGAKISAGTANYLVRKIAGQVSADTSEALAKALVGNKTTTRELLRALDKTRNVSLRDKTLVRAILFSGAAQAAQPQP